MTNKNINGPDYLDIDPKPSGIRKIRRLPFIAFTVIFVGIVVFQIFNITGKREKRLKVKKESLEQGAVAHIGKVKGDRWFDKKQYDDIRVSPNKDKTKDTIAVKPSPLKVQQHNGKTVPDKEDAFDEETRKTAAELYRLKQSEELEKQKAYFNALKSPGQVARFKSFRRPSFESADSQSATGNTGSGNEALISRLSENLSGGDINRQKDKIRFLKSGVLPGNYLPHLKQEAISAFEIKAGTFIPSALITGINSDLPGYVTAQVRENVYDTVTGNYLLIPQGSKLIGEYDSNITFGQNRALVVWTRLIYPDGSSVNLEKMQGVDVSGYAGFKDKLNHHYFRIYGNALLLSLVGAGYEFLNPDVNSEDPVQTVAANIGQQLAQTVSEVTRRNIDIQPTIIIRPGFKFNVFVLKDMILNEVTDNEL